MKATYTSKSIISIFILIVIVVFIMSTALFLYKFADSELSDKMTDWGSFGDYIVFPMTLLTIILLLLTFWEQKRTNDINQFETTFWRLYDKMELNNIDDVFTSIRKHFGNNALSTDIGKSEYALLLQYYWGIATLGINTRIETLFNVVIFVLTDERINNKDKAKYISIVYSQISERDFFCLICFVFWLHYNKQYSKLIHDPMLFSFQNFYDKKIKALIGLLKTKQEIEILHYEYDDKDKYGDLGNRINEFYIDTLKRLNLR